MAIDTSVVQFELLKIFQEATAKSVALAGKRFAAIAAEYGDAVKNQAGLARTNRFLASEMREAVLDAYRTNVQATAESGYRQGQGRFSGGQLLSALQDDRMAIGTADGIGFIDADLLDQKAKFWARLNFGADPGQGRTHPAVPRPNPVIRWGANQQYMNLRLRGDQRPAFRVPEAPGLSGYWIGRQFHVGKPKARSENVKFLGFPKQSQVGIGARRFLDAGLVRLAKEFKPAYDQYLVTQGRRIASRNSHRIIKA